MDLLNYMDRLLCANILCIPLLIWRVHPVEPPPILLHCFLHACTAAAATAPWHAVQHVLIDTDVMVRIETTPPLTEHLATRVRDIAEDYCNVYRTARLRLHHLSPSSPHNLAAQQHLCQRWPGTVKHTIHPALPFPASSHPTRGTRTSHRSSTAAVIAQRIPPLLRHLPLLHDIQTSNALLNATQR